MIDSISDEPASTVNLRRSAHRPNSASVPDRLPPHAIDAERGALACLMLSPNDCVPELIARFRGDWSAFYDLRHQLLAAEFAGMFDARLPIDSISLMNRLRDKQLLEQIGGVGYIAELPDAAPSAANFSYYLDIINDKYLLRRMIRACTEVVGRIYDYEGEVDALMDEVERDILRISESRVQEQSREIKELVRRAIGQVEEFHQRQGLLTGVGTGFTDLDKMTSGLHPGEMIVIAARPSIGKTSLAMNIAEHVALEQKLPVGVFSLEMTSESLVLRMLCSRSRVNLRNVRDGFLAERDFPKLTNAAVKLSHAPLFIDDSSGLSILELRAKARRMHQQHGIKLLVIDYLQLLHSSARRAENRQQEIADISSGIKALAKELKIPVVVLSQLNREMERDRSRKPRMSDLRESGAIEQDADVVGLLYKPASGDDDAAEEESEAIPVNLLLAKQRNGPTGDVHLTFLKSFTRFENASRVEAEDYAEAQNHG